MKIGSTEFGSITVNDTAYGHDVLIHLSGKVARRKKKLSKKHYGAPHIISLEEAEYVTAARSIPMTPATCSPGSMVAFRSTPRCASPARTGPDWNVCCATVPARGSLSALPGIAASRLATTRGSSWPTAVRQGAAGGALPAAPLLGRNWVWIDPRPPALVPSCRLGGLAGNRAQTTKSRELEAFRCTVFDPRDCLTADLP